MKLFVMMLKCCDDTDATSKTAWIIGKVTACLLLTLVYIVDSYNNGMSLQTLSKLTMNQLITQ